MTSFFLRLPLVLLLIIVVLPLMLLGLTIQFILFISRLPFYIHHKSKYHWNHNKNNPEISSMDLASKVVYGGAYPLNQGLNLYVHAGLYLDDDINQTELINKIKFLYSIPRFRYIPHWNHKNGIAEFCSENNSNSVISDHIHEYHTTKDKLQSIMDEIRNKTLNRNIPFWDISLIHYKQKAVILMRWDHCLGDGITFLKHIAPRLLQNENKESIDFGSKLKRQPKRLKNSISLIKIAINAIWRALLFLISKNDTNLPILNDMGCKHGKQKFYHKQISLNNIQKIYNLLNNNKKIRKYYNICQHHHFSTNDILLSLSSGAIRQSLISEYKQKYDQNTVNQLISSINNGEFKSLLISSVPSSVKSKTFNNNYIPLSVPFLINIRNDILRIINTSYSILPQKSGWNIILTTLLFEIIGFVSIDFVKIMNYRSVTAFTNHHSSLKGPSYPIYFNGIKVNDISVHVGDTVKTHVIEILCYNNTASINMSVNQKYFYFAEIWGQKFENLTKEIVDQLNGII